MILIYTHKITHRVRYIFKHIFTRTLLIEINFTSKLEDFVAHNGPKLSYTKVPLGGEFFIKSNPLLFEQGVNNVDINISKWNSIPCFFPCGRQSSIPFDIFAASFYLISRYEEYLPHVKDKHNRFKAEESIAFKYRFLEKPVVDIWSYMLLSRLKERFPDYKYTRRKYNYISTIAVNTAYNFRHKGFIRTTADLFLDITNLKIREILHRFTVRINLRKDPFDTFQEILNLKKSSDVRTILFFLVSDYTKYDNNISTDKTKFRLLIKNMVDYARVGLQASYYSTDTPKILKKEKERLESVTNFSIKRSRQHYLRFTLPETYQQLIDLEIEEDYSMGYPNHTGFRASTCTPFYFYDIDFEIQTPLKIFPIALIDYTLKKHMKLTPKQSLGKIRDLKDEVERVNGTFITVFHNENLSGYSYWKGWKHLYRLMLRTTKKS